jgi:hypothetical protein
MYICRERRRKRARKRERERRTCWNSRRAANVCLLRRVRGFTSLAPFKSSYEVKEESGFRGEPRGSSCWGEYVAWCPRNLQVHGHARVKINGHARFSFAGGGVFKLQTFFGRAVLCEEVALHFAKGSDQAEEWRRGVIDSRRSGGSTRGWAQTPRACRINAVGLHL